MKSEEECGMVYDLVAAFPLVLFHGVIVALIGIEDFGALFADFGDEWIVVQDLGLRLFASHAEFQLLVAVHAEHANGGLADGDVVAVFQGYARVLAECALRVAFVALAQDRVALESTPFSAMATKTTRRAQVLPKELESTPESLPFLKQIRRHGRLYDW